MDEEKRRLQSTREEVGDASGGRRIDLESGTVKISRKPKADEPTTDQATADEAAPDELAAEDSADETSPSSTDTQVMPTGAGETN